MLIAKPCFNIFTYAVELKTDFLQQVWCITTVPVLPDSSPLVTEFHANRAAASHRKAELLEPLTLC